jgi:hypothetical protein
LEELQRIENEMRQNFVNKVREKDLELKRNEKEVCSDLYNSCSKRPI